MNPATDREISGPPRRVSPDLSQEFPSRRRRLPRWVTVPALVAALLFGSWAASHLPTSDSVTNDQFLRAGTTGQDVELRMGSVKVTQVRSGIGGTHRQRESLKTLGLRKIRQSVVREDTPSVRGLIATVHHLVTVEEV